MSIAVAGHGATLAVELDPVASPGVFTTIAELNSDLTGLGLSRPETNVTPHEDTIDSWVTGVLMREPWTVSVNYIHGNATHDALRGFMLENDPADRRTGFRFRGPQGTSGVDEIIASGEVTSWNETNPVREGARTAEVTMRMSKAMKIDGVVYGQAA